VFDITGGSTAQGAGVQLWDLNYTAAQRFKLVPDGNGYYSIVNLNSGLALDVSGAEAKNGAVVWQWEQNNSDAQKWMIEYYSSSFHTLLPKLDGSMSLDVSGGSDANGAKLQLWTSNDSFAQRFLFRYVYPEIHDGVFLLDSQLAYWGVIDIAGGSTANGGNAQIWTVNASPAQLYSIAYDEESGYFVFTNQKSGKVLDVAGGYANSGSNVWQWESNGSLAQKWAIVRSSSNIFTIRSAIGGCCLDIAGGYAQSGANVQVWEPNGSLAQSWVFIDQLSANTLKDGNWATETIAQTYGRSYGYSAQHASLRDDIKSYVYQLMGTTDCWIVTDTIGRTFVVRINDGYIRAI
jgi:hypothetical protein